MTDTYKNNGMTGRPDLVLAAGGSGTGDMLAATYDPNNKAADAFARANFTGTESADVLIDGTTNKAYTATEKTKLAGIATGATAGDSTAIHKAVAAEISVITAKTTPVSGDYLLIEDSSAANAKKSITVGSLPFLPPGTTTASIAASTNKNYVTDAQLTVIGNTSGTNTGDSATPAETSTTIGSMVAGATAKTTPVDADNFPISDSAASNILKKYTFANLKAFLKTYFDTLYPSGSGVSTGTNTGDQDLTGYAHVAGQLGNTSASPDVRGLRETSGPTLLTIGDVADGQYVKRSGSILTGGTPSGGGGAAAKQVIVDFGTTAVESAEFTITDADVTTASLIVCSMAYNDITGDNNADEIEMSKVMCSAGKPQIGSFTLTVISNDGPISGKFAVNYAPTLGNPMSAVTVPVRQTVLSSGVDVNGYANFITIGTGLSVNLSATTTPIILTAANGFSLANGAINRLGAISADTSISSLTANAINYLFADIAADGSTTLGKTTLAPIYQFGGTPAVTSGQFTFNIQQMQGFVGNGSTAPQTFRMFLGEALCGASTVTSVVSYALLGRYDSGLVATLPGNSTKTSLNHNLGVGKVLVTAQLYAECIVAEQGYVVGDRINPQVANAAYAWSLTVAINNKIASFRTNTAGWVALPDAGGVMVALTAANWKYGMFVTRGW